MKYVFAYRREGQWFWRKHMVIGHRFDAVIDKMVLYFENGGLREISNWKNCEVKLGFDWLAASKEDMSKTAGQKIV